MVTNKSANSSSLIRSIVLTLCLYFLIQAGLIISISLVSGSQYLWSLLFAVGLHVVLIVLLSMRITDFEMGGKTVRKINLANQLTLFRMSSIPAFLQLLLIAESQREFVPLLLFVAALISLTDLFDGMLARKLHQQTKIGRYLDSTSDYGFLFVITGAFLNKGLVPQWFIVLILLRYSFQSLAAIMVLVRYQRPSSGATLLGKAAVFFLVLYYNLVFLSLLPRMGFLQNILQLLPWACGSVLAVSLIERVLLFIKDIHPLAASGPSSQNS